MTTAQSLRHRLVPPADVSGVVAAGLRQTGIGFAAAGGRAEARWHQALTGLAGCVRPVGGSSGPILCEGDDYPGAWIESTGTISAEVLDRFAPAVSRRTQLEFARLTRDDGLMPYKLTDDGPGYAQVQIVTPLARSVWKHDRLTGAPPAYRRAMYDAMAAMDRWLAAHRDSRGSGGVEAFCAFDTGHDRSPRFWFAPQRCPGGDAGRFDASYPPLPYIAPDLTANVACQRHYLSLIAADLGEDPAPWRRLADASTAALWERCFDPVDQFFYDCQADGAWLRLQSDVLGRVLACEVGDETFFVGALRRYLMNTGKFLSANGVTSLALDDPRFDHDYQSNSWGGPVNLLTMLRLPEAFERHGHVAELAMIERPVLTALLSTDRFPQCLDPWTGAPGFADNYSPAMLWLLDAIERTCGIQPRPDGRIWFSGLGLSRLESGQAAGLTGYARRVGTVRYESLVDDERVRVLANGDDWLDFPAGWRVVVEAGQPRAVVGLRADVVSGHLRFAGGSLGLELAPNQTVVLERGRVVATQAVDCVAPVWS